MKAISGFRILKQLYTSNYMVMRYVSDMKSSKSFALSVFDGNVDTSQLFPYPKVLTNEQEETVHQMLGPIVKFFEETNNAAKNDELETIEPKSFECLKDLGAFGLQVPEQYGGIGLNNTQYARLVEIVGRYDMGVGIALGAHQSIGFKGILLYGTEQQKAKYFPDLASGKKIAAYCLTETCAGSDAQSIQSRAVKSADGSHYILNGSKLWISNGGIADIFTVFAQTSVETEAGVKKDKITAFIVERGFGGITHSPPEKKMGIKCSNTAALFFDNCKIPAENVLGGEGNGFKVAMNILNNGRFGMAAGLTGTMRTCIEKSVAHVNERSQFGNKIRNFGSIQEKITRMAIKQYITESMAFAISANMDRGVQDFQIEAAISKVYASEAAWFCSDEAIQILGGMGFMKECGLEKIMRDMRIFRIFEGSNDVLRLFLVSQGLMHVGKMLKNTNIIRIALNKILPKSFSNEISKVVHPSLEKSSKKLMKSIQIFESMVSTLLMKHRKDIINKQFHLKRLADCIMEIYGMAVVLSRATLALNNSEPTAQYQANLANLACSLGFNFVNQTSDEIRVSLRDEFDEIKSISDQICQFGGVIQPNPLGI